MADKDSKNPEVVYTKPTSQLDLEARMERGNLPENISVDNSKNDYLNPEVTVAPYATEDTDLSHYRGTDPIYMTHSDDTSKPLAADDGAEVEALKLQESGVANVRKVTGPPNEVGTESGVGSTETLNTAVSGDTYAPKLVDAEPDYAGSPGGVIGLPESESQTVVTTKTTGATKSPATPAAAPKTRSTSNS